MDVDDTYFVVSVCLINCFFVGGAWYGIGGIRIALCKKENLEETCL